MAFGYLAKYIIVDLSLDGESWATLIDTQQHVLQTLCIKMNSYLIIVCSPIHKIRMSDFCNQYIFLAEFEVFGNYIPVMPMAAVRLKGRQECSVEIVEVKRSCTYIGNTTGVFISYKTDCESIDSVIGLSFVNESMAESYVQALTWYMQPNNAEIAANASKLKTYVENGMAPDSIYWLAQRPNGVSHIHEARGHLGEIDKHHEGNIDIIFDRQVTNDELIFIVLGARHEERHILSDVTSLDNSDWQSFNSNSTGFAQVACPVPKKLCYNTNYAEYEHALNPVNKFPPLHPKLTHSSNDRSRCVHNVRGGAKSGITLMVVWNTGIDNGVKIVNGTIGRAVTIAIGIIAARRQRVC